MLTPNKHNIHKFLFAASAVFASLSYLILVPLQGKGNEFVTNIIVKGTLPASIMMSVFGILTWITGRRSPKSKQESAREKADDLLDKIANSKVGPLLTKAPPGVVRVSELLEDLDIPERPIFENLLEALYELTPACLLPRSYGETAGSVLDWHQYDLCIIAAREDIGLAKEIRDALLKINNDWRIYLDAEGDDWMLVQQESWIKRVFYGSSCKCLALLSVHMIANKSREREELNYAMQREQEVRDEDCRNYLIPIPIDRDGLAFMRKDKIYLGKYAKNVQIFRDQSNLPQAVVNKLAPLLKKSMFYVNHTPTLIHEDEEPKKRFAIALSFPSERQEFVRAVVEELEKRLRGEEVFYYPRLEHELSGGDLRTNLHNFYRNRAELVVVFLCSEYASSRWCRREWRAIRDLLNQERLSNIMLLRFDNAPIPRLPSTYAYNDCAQRDPAGVAELIMQRLTLNRQQG